MPTPNKTRQEYRTVKQEKHQRTLLVVLSFLAFVAVLAAASGLYYLKEAGKTVDDPTTAPSEQSTQASVDALGSADFLLVLDSDAQSTAAVVRIEAQTREAQVAVLSKKQRTALESGGVASPAQAKKSLAEQLGVTVDRAVLVNESGFKDIVNEFGGLELVLDEQTEFVWDGTRRTLLAGKSRQRGESLLRFVQWCAQEGDTQTQGDIFCGLLALGLSENSHAKGEARFTRLINAVDSDITALDYLQARAALDYIAAPGQTLLLQTVALDALTESEAP
ncbi:MAG: LCP family protein [Oscillospiraceae bacterium]|jgi:anionic cell wall polymer biosynthesis LytR-Cps2A-Psr (LCP) family protein|nr:LCP family protein [Oscillospiraceae bacterium]